MEKDLTGRRTINYLMDKIKSYEFIALLFEILNLPKLAETILGKHVCKDTYKPEEEINFICITIYDISIDAIYILTHFAYRVRLINKIIKNTFHISMRS